MLETCSVYHYWYYSHFLKHFETASTLNHKRSSYTMQDIFLYCTALEALTAHERWRDASSEWEAAGENLRQHSCLRTLRMRMPRFYIRTYLAVCSEYSEFGCLDVLDRQIYTCLCYYWAVCSNLIRETLPIQGLRSRHIRMYKAIQKKVLDG